jgi:pyruvate/2-oxoglutarate dehydrogenase complex dihydrolipoamide dehydrogenase (E3) component
MYEKERKASRSKPTSSTRSIARFSTVKIKGSRECISEKPDKILGATIVAAHAGDMINEFSVR